MNPWVLLAGVLAWLATTGGAGVWAYGAGQAAELATQQREDRAVAATRDAAASATGAAIARLRPQITTIRQETEREIRTNTVYADCRHSAEQLQRLNAALTGAPAEPAGRGLVPPADALGR